LPETKEESSTTLTEGQSRQCRWFSRNVFCPSSSWRDRI